MTNVEISPRSEWTPERVAALSRNMALVVVAGIVFGVFATFANVYYVGTVVAAAALVMVVAWQFEAALVIYALAAFVPWGQTPDLAVGGSGLGKGLYISEIMLGFLLVIWLGKYFLGGLPKERIRCGFYIPVGLYLGYCVLNVVHSFIFWDPHVNKMYQHPSVNVIEVGIRFMSVGALVMIATSITNRKWLVWTSVFAMIPGLYNLANGLAGNIVPVSAPWWPLIALLPVGYALAVALEPGEKWAKRVAGMVVVGVAIFVVLVMSIGWVSGWLGLMVALGVVALIRNWKVFAAAVVLTAVVLFVSWAFVQQNVVEESQNAGDYDRFALLRGAWKYATTFPLGVGLGNYRTYNSFHYGVEWGTTTYTSAHGTYAQHLSETGIPGLVLFLSILIGGFRWMLAGYRKLSNAASKRFLLAAMGQLAGVGCAAFFGDYIIPSFHNGGLVTFSATIYSWIVWGLAVAHVRLGDNGPVHIDS